MEREKYLKNVPEAALDIMESLESAGHKAWLVGGGVRDLLLGRAPNDFDITTDALPDEVEALFSHTVPIGKEHGTVGVIAGEIYEVTTYRIDGQYSDNRHPDEVIFTRSLEEDLKRRDFTVNALAMDRHGNIADKVGGLDDLKAGVLRAVGDAAERFNEDALRILRGVRFSAQLAGFVIEPATAAAIHELKPLLHNIAAERIRAELDKMLAAPGAVTALREYRDVFAEFIPELAEGFDFDQQNPFHCYDVYEHILHTVDAVLPQEDDRAYLTVRIAALLHDIGKPACFVVKDGWGHFYGHEHLSADMAREIMNRLKYDRRTRDDVVSLIRVHGTVFRAEEKYAKHKLNQLGEELLRMLIALERADVSAQSEMVRSERTANIDLFAGIVEKVIEEQQCFSLKDLAVRGSDLIEIGVLPGPELGKTLSVLLEKVINGEIENDKTPLSNYVKRNIRAAGTSEDI